MKSIHDKINEIIGEVVELRENGVDLKDSRLEYISIFTQEASEFEFYSEEALKLGNLLKEHTSGIFVKLNEAITTAEGDLQVLKIRKPDDKYVIGAADYYSENYESLKREVDSAQIARNSLDIEIIQLNPRDSKVIVAIISQDIAGIFSNATEPKNLEVASSNELEEEKLKRIQLMADFQNYKKRVETERATFGAIANMSLIQDILEIYDDLELAMHDSELNIEGAKSSIKIAQDKLNGAVLKAGIEKVEVKVGDDFDKEKMEAISTIPNEQMKNKVIAVISSAYKYVGQNNILKAAKVIIGK